jgi:hypothetical protein
LVQFIISKEYLESKGHYYILSAHTGRDADLWSVIKDELLPNTWRQYYNQQTNQMASIFSDHGIHCCLSNAYIPINLLNQSLEKCPLSERYKEQFNVVDLCDRRVYGCPFPHNRMKVNDVLFVGMLHITIINSLVIYNNQEHAEQLSLRHYMEKLCKCLLSN